MDGIDRLGRYRTCVGNVARAHASRVWQGEDQPQCIVSTYYLLFFNRFIIPPAESLLSSC